MFTDMVGFSSRAQADEEGTLALLQEHNRILRPFFSKYHGREIKTVGDAFLVEFSSALDAARCALEIQRTLHDRNASAPASRKIQIRIGIHVGDVVEEEGDVLGDTVNIASRIQRLAEPGGICISQPVFDQVQNKLDVTIVQLPAVSLKNIRTPVTVYRIGSAGNSPAPGPRSSPAIHSLAVLPLSNISPDPKDEYFADGLTEELISVLSQVHGLSVIARSSVTQYKAAPKPIAQVGAELGVESVLEGSVRKAGNRIRVTLQLVDVPTQRHIWAGSYNREIDDVFGVQSDVADRTAEALSLELTKSERLAVQRRPTSNPEAYDLYLRGLVSMGRPRDEGLNDSTRFFERATQLDPNFAEAYAAWANLYVAVSGDYMSVREAMPRARELAARALALNPASSEAHSTLANIAMQFDHDWPRAEAEFRTAIELNPNNEPAYSFYGLLLLALERFEEAKEIYRQAILRDPAAYHERHLAWAELESGNFDRAIEYARADVRREPNDVHTHVFLGLFYLYAGRSGDAQKEAQVPLGNSPPIVRFDHALLNALVGRPAEAQEILRRAASGDAGMYLSFTDLAMLHAALGDKPAALELLEKDTREGDGTLWLYYRGVFFDSIRNDPRFIALLKELHLPTSGVRRGSSP